MCIGMSCDRPTRWRFSVVLLSNSPIFSCYQNPVATQRAPAGVQRSLEYPPKRSPPNWQITPNAQLLSPMQYSQHATLFTSERCTSFWAYLLPEGTSGQYLGTWALKFSVSSSSNNYSACRCMSTSLCVSLAHNACVCLGKYSLFVLRSIQNT
jgi:hypothetical protein